MTVKNEDYMFIRLQNALKWRWSRLRNPIISRLSLLLATVLGLPGVRFGWFGIWCSRKCSQAGYNDLAQSLSITPVNCVRYFEFDFAWQSLQIHEGARCLDVSSPRLFGAYVLKKYGKVDLEVVNPSMTDLDTTKRLYSCIGDAGECVRFHNLYADHLPWDDDTFDCIWCISVLEHIPRPDDHGVFEEMGRVLKAGGQMVVTVPFARKGFDEYSSNNVYGLDANVMDNEKRFFFQRWYDEETLSQSFGQSSCFRRIKQELWGENKPGWFDDYLARWRVEGEKLTSKDPVNMLACFRHCKDLDDIHDRGIISLLFEKV